MKIIHSVIWYFINTTRNEWNNLIRTNYNQLSIVEIYKVQCNNGWLCSHSLKSLIKRKPRIRPINMTKTLCKSGNACLVKKKFHISLLNFFLYINVGTVLMYHADAFASYCSVKFADFILLSALFSCSRLVCFSALFNIITVTSVLDP